MRSMYWAIARPPGLVTAGGSGLCHADERARSDSTPLADRRDDLTRGVLLHVVAGALHEHRSVVGEHLLPAPALARAERGVAGRPHDQRRAVGEDGKPALHFREERAAAQDLARQHVHRAARRWVAERAAV